MSIKISIEYINRFELLSSWCKGISGSAGVELFLIKIMLSSWINVHVSSLKELLRMNKNTYMY